MAAEAGRHRCQAERDGRRCQLLRGHPTGHAVAAAPNAARVRWDDARTRDEVRAYGPGSTVLERLRWAPGFPR